MKIRHDSYECEIVSILFTIEKECYILSLKKCLDVVAMLHYSTLMLALDPMAVDEGHPWNIMRHPVNHRIPNEIPLVKHSRKSHHFHASYTCSPKNVQQIKSVGNIPLSPRSQE